MTYDEALSRLRPMVAADVNPKLDSDELDELVVGARRDDAAGVAPDGAGWVETYDLNAAAAEGWRRKAGKVAPLYDFAIDNQRSEEGDVYTHCLSQAEHYARLQSSYVRLR